MQIEEVSVALRETKFKVDVVDQNLSLKIAEALKEQREAQQVNEDLLRRSVIALFEHLKQQITTYTRFWSCELLC